ncbi:MAG: enoyl-CoA hydratase/isomerase family protein, partial [Anaerolineales bacterium]
MSYETILTEIRGRVGILTLNRPDTLNALNAQMNQEMRQQFRVWNEDESVGAIVITGAGRGFCSGADITGFEATARGERRTNLDRQSPTEWQDLCRESKPIVCAINGVAVGQGITMTLTCDVRVASDAARMSFRFVRIGLTPEFGSTHFLPHLVGLGRTLELMLTGKFISAEEALEIGLVNHVYSADTMLDEAAALAQDMAANPAWQLQQSKRQIYDHYLEREVPGQVNHTWWDAQAHRAVFEIVHGPVRHQVEVTSPFLEHCP